MVTTRIMQQSYLLVQLNDIVEDLVVADSGIPHHPLLHIVPPLIGPTVIDPPLQKLNQWLDDLLPTVIQGELSGDGGSPDGVTKEEVVEGLPNIVAIVQPGPLDDLPSRGIATKAITIKAMVDEDAMGDGTRVVSVVLIQAVGLDDVGTTSEQGVADLLTRGRDLLAGGRHIDGWQEGKSNFDGDSSLS